MLLTLFVSPAEIRTVIASSWEVTACTQPRLAIHLHCGWPVLPTRAISREHWTLYILEFGGVVWEGCSFLSVRGSHGARAHCAVAYLIAEPHLQGVRLLVCVAVAFPFTLYQALF